MKDIYLKINESIMTQDPAYKAAQSFNKFISEYEADEIDDFVNAFMNEITNRGEDELLLRSFQLYLDDKK